LNSFAILAIITIFQALSTVYTFAHDHLQIISRCDI